MPFIRFSRGGLVRRRIAAALAALVAATTFAIIPGATPALGQTVDTPDPGSCAADILFILDASGSMVSAGLDAVEEAVETFTAELGMDPADGGAPDSRIAAVHFSNGAATGIASYLNVVTDKSTIDDYVSSGGAYRSYPHNWTNWQAAFEQANTLATPDHVFFLTDGQPTRTNSTPGTGGNTNYNANAAAAVPAATILKNAVPGTNTVVGIGVGDDFTDADQANNVVRLASVVDQVTTSSVEDLAEALALQINLVCEPSISITKTATPDVRVEPGGDFVFGVTVTNTSSSGADVQLTSLTDQVEGQAVVDITAIPGSSCIYDSGGASFSPATDWIAAGESVTCSWTTTLNGPPGTSESDTARASAVDPNGRTTGPVAATESISISDDPSVLAVDKSASPETLDEPGGDVTYTVVVENESNVDSITLSTLVDDRFGDVTNTCLPTVAGVVLPPDGTHTCTFTETITIDGGGTHVNVIEITGQDDDGITRSATDDATVTVVDDPAAISLVKEASEASVVEPGENVLFTITVTNDSAVDSVTIDTLSDSEFADVDTSCAPSFLGTTLAPGESAACSFTELITGPHENTATVTGTSDDGDDLEASADATVAFVDTGASITVTKVASGGDVNVQAPGENVTFDVTVANTSPVDSVTLTSLTDQVAPGPAFPITEIAGPVIDTDCSVPQVIAAGDDYTCSFTVFVGGSDGDEVTDEVTASGVSEDDEPVTADDTETIFLDSSWRIVFNKRVCDTYGEIRSNENASQFREALLPLGPMVTGDGVPVDEAWEDANHDCTAVAGWPFTIGYGLLTPGEGPYGGLADTLSHVAEPDGTVVTDDDGRAVFELTDEQLMHLIMDQGELWIMEGAYEGLDLTFPDEDMGFGIIRCGTDVNNGDNAEFIRASDFANQEFTVTCFAYNVLEQPELAIDKDAVTLDGETYESGDVAEVGQLIGYEITTTNTGNVPLTGVTVTDDDLDGPLACNWPGAPGELGVGDGSSDTLGDGDTVVCSGTHTVTNEDGEAGSFLNVATADANEIDEPVTDDEEVPTMIPDAPALEVTKDVDLAVVEVAGTVTYTITVTNVGVLVLEDLMLVDVLSYNGTSERLGACEAPGTTTLAPGDSTSLECQQSLDILVHGTDVLNTVTATATASNDDEVFDQDTASTEILPPSTDGALDIDKLAGPLGTEAGDDSFVDLYTRASDEDAVTWQITITNERGYRLSDVTFADLATPACEAAFDAAVSRDADGAYLAPNEVLVFTCDDPLGIGVAKENVATAGATDPWDQPIPVVEDAARTQSVAASATIGDTVWSDDNRNGVQDAGEKGISGATVRLRLPDGTTIEATTNSDGRYLFSALAAGTYTVELVLSSIPEPEEGSLSLTTSSSFTVTLADGGSFLDADFGVAATLPSTGISSDRIALIGLALLIIGTLAIAASRFGMRNDEA